MKFRIQKKYPCCQLLSAINARIYLTGEDVSEEVFESLVDLVGCRDFDGEFNISKAYPLLGLDVTDGPMTADWIRANLPVEIVIHSGIEKLNRLHSVLIIDVATVPHKGFPTTFLNVVDHQWWKEPQWWQWSRLPFPIARYQRSRSFKVKP